MNSYSKAIVVDGYFAYKIIAAYSHRSLLSKVLHNYFGHIFAISISLLRDIFLLSPFCKSILNKSRNLSAQNKLLRTCLVQTMYGTEHQLVARQCSIYTSYWKKSFITLHLWFKSSINSSLHQLEEYEAITLSVNLKNTAIFPIIMTNQRRRSYLVVFSPSRPKCQVVQQCLTSFLKDLVFIKIIEFLCLCRSS